jgi:hypothetical protein
VPGTQEGCERLFRGALLGVLLRPSPADSQLLSLHERRDRKRALMRRPFDLEHTVGDLAALPRKLFLELRLVVDVARRRILDLAAKRLDDRRLDRRESVLEEERRQRSLQQRAEDVPVPCELRELLLAGLPGVLTEPPPQAELAPDDRTALPGDDVRAEPGQLPLREIRILLEQRPSDRKLEDAVPQELEPLVRLAPVGRPGGMRENLREPLRRELVDQPLELAALAVTGAT